LAIALFLGDFGYVSIVKAIWYFKHSFSFLINSFIFSILLSYS
jgi:hypothetical protein